MGFKKGRAARGAAAGDGGAAEASLRLRHDGTCVEYTAASGSEYRIDVATMQQLAISTGVRRAVYRTSACGRRPHWEFEAMTEGARNYTPPKHVTFALEERWRALQATRGEEDAFAEDAARTRWLRAVPALSDAALAGLVDHLEPGRADAAGARGENEHSGEEELGELAAAAAEDEELRRALAGRVLGAPWPARRAERALRRLMHLGLRPTPEHCRLVAIGHGSLALLRVLLVEAGVDVCGLALFAAGGPAPAKRGHAEGSWVQQSKEPLKALMARGALLGDHAPRSKLLRKLEEDGYALWTERALDGLVRGHPEVPDTVVERVRAFL